VLCTGHGVCAQTLPGAIVLDEWGYPILRHEAVEPEAAALAVKLCPARALYLRS
jgi:ferredoxin